MAKIGKVADWLGVSAPLLEAEITEVASIEGAGPNSVVSFSPGIDQSSDVSVWSNSAFSWSSACSSAIVDCSSSVTAA